MIEYNLETLVHLYDSLNDQIEKLHKDLSDIGFIDEHDLSPTKIEEIKEAREVFVERLIKLNAIRDLVEEKLYKGLNAKLNTDIVEGE